MATSKRTGARQVFGAVAKTDTDIKVLIRRSLDVIGRTEGAELTAFTDGCPGLRRILADAGVAETPILDWFHIEMRLEHLKQIAGPLTTARASYVRETKEHGNEQRVETDTEALWIGIARQRCPGRNPDKPADDEGRATSPPHRAPQPGELKGCVVMVQTRRSATIARGVAQCSSATATAEKAKPASPTTRASENIEMTTSGCGPVPVGYPVAVVAAMASAQNSAARPGKITFMAGVTVECRSG